MTTPTPQDLARTLRELAAFLELQGGTEPGAEPGGSLKAAQKSRVKDLRAAADALHDADAADLDALPDAGSEAARALVEDGEHPEHAALSDTWPADVVHFLALPGLGLTMVRRLVLEYEVTSLAQLVSEAESGELKRVKGMGKKTLQNLAPAARELLDSLSSQAEGAEASPGEADAVVTEEEEAEVEAVEEEATAEEVAGEEGAVELAEVTEDATTEEAAEEEDAVELAEVVELPVSADSDDEEEDEDDEEEDEDDETPRPSVKVVSRRRPSSEPEPAPEAEPEVAAASDEPSAEESETSSPAVLPPGLPVVLESMAVETQLRCPSCGSVGFDIWPAHGTCGGCGRAFARDHGVLDLVQEAGGGRGALQWLMDSRVYPWMYERFARPSITRLLAGRSMKGELDLALDLLELDGEEPLRVVDLACGTGLFARAIAERLGGAGEVVGLDISQSMLERAHAKAIEAGLGRIHFMRCDAHQLPLADDSVDRVHCAAALHLLPEPERVVRELERVLKPGGVAVLSTFHTGRTPVVRTVKKFVVGKASGIRLFEPQELRELVSDAGLASERESWRWSAVSVQARKVAARSLTSSSS